MALEADLPRAPMASAPNRGILLTLTILLALLLLVSGAQLAFTLQARSARAARANEAQALVTSQQTVISGLMDSYQKSAYGNTDVDTIYQQQLIASESILQALSIMAIQNSQIIELLSVSQ